MVRILVSVLATLSAASSVAQDAFERATERARELCARMTLEEKAGELTTTTSVQTVGTFTRTMLTATRLAR